VFVGGADGLTIVPNRLDQKQKQEKKYISNDKESTR